jgi:DNA (cytosine-5)-methyltransferase 1
MSKKQTNLHVKINKELLAESRKAFGLRSYISLFSSAGIGCYGFKQELFNCIATVELIEKRLKVQEYNNKCLYESGYIAGDLTKESIKQKVFKELELWKSVYKVNDLDVLIATPPCQGMSVANHKKKDELKRNSLVVESIQLTKQIMPKFFVYENVRAFLKSTCTDTDGIDKTIRQAIDYNLSGIYNIHFQVLNFKDYGNLSSRTRTLVIGVRKDLKEVTPLDLFPDLMPEKTLRQVIGNLPSLSKMGEVDPNDIYHNFRPYTPHMESWITDIKEGQSAFNNIDPSKIPHSIKDGKVVLNVQKNGDKYTRQFWEKVGPCIHTRNDILSSQNTIHPVDNRVFSIREVMMLMSVPNEFKWSTLSNEEFNLMSAEQKRAYLKKEEMNIRQSLGEAVPTIIFRQIANKILKKLNTKDYTDKEINHIIDQNDLTVHENLLKFIICNRIFDFATLSKIAELANAKRIDNSAYYTRQDICYSIVKNLPDAKEYTHLKILEPSIGVGNFLPSLLNKYKSVAKLEIDVVDIDIKSIEILKCLVAKLNIPNNVIINYINADFLIYNFQRKYDIVVGNPPFKKITKEKALLSLYKNCVYNRNTNNIFAFFIEKVITLGTVVSLIVPKSLISAPEFNETRILMNKFKIIRIIDYGEKAFKGVKIETISFIINTIKKAHNTEIESYITEKVQVHKQSYFTDIQYPYWLLYRNELFDTIANKLKFNIFKSYRDRSITKEITKDIGAIRVLKSRNISNNEIIDIKNYDTYLDDVSLLDVKKFLNKPNCFLLPNLTYNPRACVLPKNTIADGSVAILTLIDDNLLITKEDLSFYSSPEFKSFYSIARNMGTRSLNIDNNSVFFFGKLK